MARRGIRNVLTKKKPSYVREIRGLTFLENLPKRVIDTKTRDLNIRYGVDREFLTDLVTNPGFMQIMATGGQVRDSSLLFRAYLTRVKSAMSALSNHFPEINDKVVKALADPFYGEYNARIKSLVGEAGLASYLGGEWNEEITSAVARAQTELAKVSPGRTIIQQQPRVSFKMKPEWLDRKYNPF